MNQIVKFCLAVAAERSGCQIHGFCFMSNHYHLIVTDPFGTLPEFMHWFNEFVAKCLNAELGRWEYFWAPGSYGRVELVDRDRLLEALVYLITNPVTAGLVRSHRLWPGAEASPLCSLGRVEIVQRPDGFFRDEGPVPKEAALVITAPPVLADEDSQWCRELRSRVVDREGEIRDGFKRRKKGFVGAQRVLSQSPFGRPRSLAERRGLNPTVAASDRWKRAEALQRLRSFLSAYREALEQFLAGDRDARFPFGTYLMQVRFGVWCSGP